jgi:hypothetical protein
MSEGKRTEKHEAARMSLPEELRPVFDQFVLDYKFAATVHHGSPFVSYVTLAEIVKAGWRLTAKPIGRWAKENETKQ